jgi:hypothetical protein
LRTDAEEMAGARDCRSMASRFGFSIECRAVT